MPEFPGPYEIRLYYIVTPSGFTALEHVHTFDVALTVPVDPGASISDQDITLKNGVDENLLTYLNAYLAVLQPMFHTGVDINRWELWKYPDEGYDAVFIDALSIGENGTAVGVPIIGQYNLWTFRNAGGSVLKVQLMETSLGADTILAYPTGVAQADDVFEFVNALNTGHVSQNGTYPIASLRLSRGQNEAVWRRRYRPR